MSPACDVAPLASFSRRLFAFRRKSHSLSLTSAMATRHVVVTAPVPTPTCAVGVAECLSGAVPQPHDSVPLTTPRLGEACEA